MANHEKYCEHCELAFERRMKPREKLMDYRARRYCSHECRSAAKRSNPATESAPATNTLRGSTKPEPVRSLIGRKRRKPSIPPELRRQLADAIEAHPELLDVWGDNSTDANTDEFLGAKIGMGVEGAYLGSNR